MTALRTLLLTSLVSLAASAQESLSPDQFLAATATALEDFADPADALAAGYRPLGPDMPHMGQHWVHPGRAVSRDLDPSRPSMLTYLAVDGRAVLTGAAFTIPIAAGEAPPSFPASGAWHAHAGRLMDEAFGLVPHGVQDADQPRLAMLHAWTGVANPDGVWSADNWALPFVRGGYTVPHHVPPAAGRAVALAVGYEAFFNEAVSRAARPTSEEASSVAEMLARHSRRIRQRLDATPSGQAPDVDALAADWLTLWAEVERVVPRVAALTERLFGTEGDTGTHAIHEHGGGH